MSEPVLQTQQIAYSYGSKQVLASVDLCVQRGEVYGFLGLFGVKLSAIPAISVIMAVGVGVEFTAHLVLAFVEARGERQRTGTGCITWTFTDQNPSIVPPRSTMGRGKPPPGRAWPQRTRPAMAWWSRRGTRYDGVV